MTGTGRFRDGGGGGGGRETRATHITHRLLMRGPDDPRPVPGPWGLQHIRGGETDNPRQGAPVRRRAVDEAGIAHGNGPAALFSAPSRRPATRPTDRRPATRPTDGTIEVTEMPFKLSSPGETSGFSWKRRTILIMMAIRCSAMHASGMTIG